jgi:pimeloyl-ACP methyl ester carboxylesterase
LTPELVRVHLPHGVVVVEESGAGKPVVLLHGMGSSHRSWHRVRRDLSRDARVLAPDLPGYAGSDPVGVGFSPSSVADVLVAVLRDRGATDCLLVGHSLGGLVAVTLADRHPGMVRRLVLVAPAGLQPRLALPGEAIGRILEALIGVRRELGRPVATSAQARRVMFGRVVHHPERLHASDARLVLEASRGATRIRQGVKTAMHADIRSALRRLPMPVDLVWGTEDRLLSPAGVDEARAARPGIPVHLIHDVGHLPMLERPAELAAIIRHSTMADLT